MNAKGGAFLVGVGVGVPHGAVEGHAAFMDLIFDACDVVSIKDQ
jgi:hypothetical protein